MRVKEKNNLLYFNRRLRISVLYVACFVDGLSVYFASKLRLKRENMYRFIVMLIV